MEENSKVVPFDPNIKIPDDDEAKKKQEKRQEERRRKVQNESVLRLLKLGKYKDK